MKCTLVDEIKQLQQQQKTNTILLVIILIVLLVICIVWAARFLRKKRLLSTCFFKKIKPAKAPVNNSQPVGNENLPPINIPIVRNGGEAVGIGANVLSVSGMFCLLPYQTSFVNFLSTLQDALNIFAVESLLNLHLHYFRLIFHLHRY